MNYSLVPTAKDQIKCREGMGEKFLQNSLEK